MSGRLVIEARRPSSTSRPDHAFSNSLRSTSRPRGSVGRCTSSLLSRSRLAMTNVPCPVFDDRRQRCLRQTIPFCRDDARLEPELSRDADEIFGRRTRRTGEMATRQFSGFSWDPQKPGDQAETCEPRIDCIRLDCRWSVRHRVNHAEYLGLILCRLKFRIVFLARLDVLQSSIRYTKSPSNQLKHDNNRNFYRIHSKRNMNYEHLIVKEQL